MASDKLHEAFIRYSYGWCSLRVWEDVLFGLLRDE